MALDHLERSLRFDADNLRARNLKVLVLRKLGRNPARPTHCCAKRCALDPLDWWARHLRGEPLQCDLQTRLDIAHDYARAGFHRGGELARCCQTGGRQRPRTICRTKAGAHCRWCTTRSAGSKNRRGDASKRR